MSSRARVRARVRVPVFVVALAVAVVVLGTGVGRCVAHGAALCESRSRAYYLAPYEVRAFLPPASASAPVCSLSDVLAAPLYRPVWEVRYRLDLARRNAERHIRTGWARQVLLGAS